MLATQPKPVTNNNAFTVAEDLLPSVTTSSTLNSESTKAVGIKTISLELYAVTVLMREAIQLIPDVEMVGLLDDPYFIGNSYILAGHCCPEDETPYFYRISTQSAWRRNNHERNKNRVGRPHMESLQLVMQQSVARLQKLLHDDICKTAK